MTKIVFLNLYCIKLIIGGRNIFKKSVFNNETGPVHGKLCKTRLIRNEIFWK